MDMRDMIAIVVCLDMREMIWKRWCHFEAIRSKKK